MKKIPALVLFFVGAGITVVAEPPPSSGPSTIDPDLLKLGKDLFDTYAPVEVKEQFDFPSKEQWDLFAARLQKSLESGSFEDLASYEPEARAALLALRAFPDYADYADWLQERLDYIEASKEVVRTPPPEPTVPKSPSKIPPLPYYDMWVQRITPRPIPANAATLMPGLKAAFKSEGVPPELAWVAEAESSLNTQALSPAGARGLFQLMPNTAKSLGLSTFMPDERTDPQKSAHAAAKELRNLHERFGSWPLALAAYNAGEGRVGRALAGRPKADFAAIAPTLPVETRMYVPKVLATVAVREKHNVDTLLASPQSVPLKFRTGRTQP
ncbi:MAG TPA: lytic transglycosylase domain-containing protein [Opitutaceae bacterium]|nr:lytic transglycosylase domain-containing protein [Opitutaceae bacterium]